MPSTCTVSDTFANIPLGECGQPATTTVTSHCGRGHADTVPMCDQHAATFAHLDDVALSCSSCYEQGRRGEPITRTSAGPLAVKP